LLNVESKHDVEGDMPPTKTETVTKFCDGHERPQWAGSVILETQRVAKVLSFAAARRNPKPSETPRWVRDGGGRLKNTLRIKKGERNALVRRVSIDRPVMVEGIVLPYASTKPWAGADDMPESPMYHAGHVLARSSGGPDAAKNLVAQLADINTDLLVEDTSGELTRSDLKWRQMELYAQFWAQEGFSTTGQTPRDEDRFRFRTAPQKGYFGIALNGAPFAPLKFLKASDYQKMQNPRLLIKFVASISYDDPKRGNDPNSLDAKLLYSKRDGKWIEFFSQSFSNELTNKVLAKQSDKVQRLRMKKLGQYKVASLRRATLRDTPYRQEQQVMNRTYKLRLTRFGK
jgi:hypothetical protein